MNDSRSREPFIVIACSFRSFNNSTNDRIQHSYLNSLKDQKRVNIIVCAVQFGEIGIKEVLGDSGLEHLLIDLGSQKYSHTEVVLQTLKHFPGTKIFWSTVDLNFPSDFFYFASMQLESAWMVTSHPHIIDDERYPNDVAVWRRYKGYGFDLIGLSASAIETIKPDLISFRNVGWGGFEHQLIAFGRSRKPKTKKMINMAPRFFLSKYTNPKEELNEPNKLLQDEWYENYLNWLPWLEKQVPYRQYLDLKYCNFVFKTKLRLRLYMYFSYLKSIDFNYIKPPTLVMIASKVLRKLF